MRVNKKTINLIGICTPENGKSEKDKEDFYDQLDKQY